MVWRLEGVFGAQGRVDRKGVPGIRAVRARMEGDLGNLRLRRKVRLFLLVDQGDYRYVLDIKEILIHVTTVTV